MIFKLSSICNKKMQILLSKKTEMNVPQTWMLSLTNQKHKKLNSLIPKMSQLVCKLRKPLKPLNFLTKKSTNNLLLKISLPLKDNQLMKIPHLLISVSVSMKPLKLVKKLLDFQPNQEPHNPNKQFYYKPLKK